jgi:hypothetical protein
MKTNIVYGLYLTLALLLLNLVFYFLGYHSDAEKFATADTISKIAFWVFAAVFIVLGTRARRSEIPPTENFGYGSALLSGFLISLFSGLFGIITNYLYMQVINRGFIDVIIQAATAKAEAKGAGAAQIEQMEKGIRFMMNPVFSGIFILILMTLCGTLIALVTAAFLKRPAQDNLAPPVAA